MSNKVAVNIRTLKQQEKLFKAYEDIDWVSRSGLCVLIYSNRPFYHFGKESIIDFNDRYEWNSRDYYNGYAKPPEIITVPEAIKRLKKMKEAKEIDDAISGEAVKRMGFDLDKHFKPVEEENITDNGDGTVDIKAGRSSEAPNVATEEQKKQYMKPTFKVGDRVQIKADVSSYGKACATINAIGNDNTVSLINITGCWQDHKMTFPTDMIKPVEELSDDAKDLLNGLSDVAIEGICKMGEEHKPKIITLDESTNVEGRFKLVSVADVKWQARYKQYIGQVFTKISKYNDTMSTCKERSSTMLIKHGATFEVLEEEPKTLGQAITAAEISLDKKMKEEYLRGFGKTDNKRISQAMLALHDVEITEENIGRVEELLNHLNN